MFVLGGRGGQKLLSVHLGAGGPEAPFGPFGHGGTRSSFRYMFLGGGNEKGEQSSGALGHLEGGAANGHPAQRQNAAKERQGLVLFVWTPVGAGSKQAVLNHGYTATDVGATYLG